LAVISNGYAHAAPGGILLNARLLLSTKRGPPLLDGAHCLWVLHVPFSKVEIQIGCLSTKQEEPYRNHL